MQKALGPTDRKAFRDNYLAAMLISLALLISCGAFAQVDTTQNLTPVNGNGFMWKNGAVNGGFRIPRDTFQLRVSDSGAIAYKGGNLYAWNGHNWSLSSGSGVSDTATINSKTSSLGYTGKFLGSGMYSDIPAAAIGPGFFYAKDSLRIYFTDGTSWSPITDRPNQTFNTYFKRKGNLGDSAYVTGSPTDSSIKIAGIRDSGSVKWLVMGDGTRVIYAPVPVPQVFNTNSDSVKKLPVDTSARRNGYCMIFDSTNHKWYLGPCGSGGGGTSNISVTRAAKGWYIASSTGTGDSARLADLLNAGLIDTALYRRLISKVYFKNDTATDLLADSSAYALNDTLFHKPLVFTNSGGLATVTHSPNQHKMKFDVNVGDMTKDAYIDAKSLWKAGFKNLQGGFYLDHIKYQPSPTARYRVVAQDTSDQQVYSIGQSTVDSTGAVALAVLGLKPWVFLNTITGNYEVSDLPPIPLVFSGTKKVVASVPGDSTCINCLANVPGYGATDSLGHFTYGFQGGINNVVTAKDTTQAKSRNVTFQASANYKQQETVTLIQGSSNDTTAVTLNDYQIIDANGSKNGSVTFQNITYKKNVAGGTKQNFTGTVYGVLPASGDSILLARFIQANIVNPSGTGFDSVINIIDVPAAGSYSNIGTVRGLNWAHVASKNGSTALTLGQNKGIGSYNIYAPGTADNYFKGRVTLDSPQVLNNLVIGTGTPNILVKLPDGTTGQMPYPTVSAAADSGISSDFGTFFRRVAGGTVFINSDSGFWATRARVQAGSDSLKALLALKAPLASPTFTGTPAAPTASPGTNSTQVATTAYADAIGALKANLASPTFTGTPVVPTAAPGTNTTQAASTAFVTAAVSAATTGVSSFNTRTGAVTPASGDYTVAQVTGAAPLASPVLTGTPTVPTAAPGTNTTQAASTAFVTTADNLKANLASPTFTGTPVAPTASPGTNNTQIATTAYADAIAALKANLVSPTFTGTPSAPTASAGNNSGQIATTQYVDALHAVSGTFTSTLSNGGNATSISFNSAKYIRVGSMVHMNITLSLNAINANTPTTINFSLPFTTSNGSQIYVGVGSSYQSGGGALGGTSVTSTTGGVYQFFATNTSTYNVNIQLDYSL